MSSAVSVTGISSSGGTNGVSCMYESYCYVRGIVLSSFQYGFVAVGNSVVQRVNSVVTNVGTEMVSSTGGIITQ